MKISYFVYGMALFGMNALAQVPGIGDSITRRVDSLYAVYPTDRAHFFVPMDSVVDEFMIDMEGFISPLPGLIVTSKYGTRLREMHYGIDFLTEVGDSIYAPFGGTVRLVSVDWNGYGKFIIIRHHNRLETLYGHIEKSLLQEGDSVLVGQPIALAGNTGRSTGPHLHWEIGFLGVPINPERLFDVASSRPYGRQFLFDKRTFQRPARWAPKRMRVYTVAAGDTWESIGKYCRRNPRLLAKLNHIPYDSALVVGQTINY